MMMRPYVYRLQHPTGRFYIGVRYANRAPALEDLGVTYFSSATDPFVREHFEEFDRHIVREFDDREAAIDFEQDLIQEHWGDPNLLNRAIHVTKSFRCVGHSIETRAKMSAQKKGKRPNNFGKPMSAHRLELLSATSRNQIHTPERRAKSSLEMMGNTRGLGNRSRSGHTNSEETNRKISEALIGREGWKPTDEQKRHTSDVAKNRPRVSCVECRKELQAQQLSRHFSGRHQT